jgi:hypothetical protein
MTVKTYWASLTTEQRKKIRTSLHYNLTGDDDVKLLEKQPSIDDLRGLLAQLENKSIKDIPVVTSTAPEVKISVGAEEPKKRKYTRRK